MNEIVNLKWYILLVPFSKEFGVHCIIHLYDWNRWHVYFCIDSVNTLMEWFCNCKLGNEDCKISNIPLSVFFTFWIVSYAGWTVGLQGSTAGEAMVMSSAEEELASRWRERGVMWAPVKLWRHRRLEECAILLSRAAKERRHESWAAEREERLCGVELTV